MADTTATVEQDFVTTASVSNTVTSTSLNNIENVDTTTNGLSEGSILIYKTATQNWTAATELADQEITGGQY